MTFFWILKNSYLHPRQAMDALAQKNTPVFGATYTLIRSLLLALLFYLPFHLLKFKPITPAYLKIFDTPDYFLIAVFIWPIFGMLSWVYLSGVIYVTLRILGYPANFDQVLNLEGLLNLTIGIVLLFFDWFTVAINFHNSAILIGIAHMVIADPWAITLYATFFKKYYRVPVWISVFLGILVRLAYFPLALVFIRT